MGEAENGRREGSWCAPVHAGRCAAGSHGVHDSHTDSDIRDQRSYNPPRDLTATIRRSALAAKDLRMPAQYAIGIDLGTTNSVLAYARLGDDRPQLQLLPIPQLVAAGTVEDRGVLSSFLYLGTEAEAGSGSL